uniref:Peptidase S1 domain-containing protein n=1 Tax=Parastrongyloides trichosuri TaxID=131310 RepID=A0A0N4ZU41_PARTI
MFNKEENDVFHSVHINEAVYNKESCGILHYYDYSSDDIPDDGTYNFREGGDNIHESKIMGGKDVDISKEPWAVQIYLMNKFLCGGTLVARNYVMTAAHCIKENCHAFKIQKKDLEKLEVLINFPGNEMANYLDETLKGGQLPFLRTHVRSISLPAIDDDDMIICQGVNDFALLELDTIIPEGYSYACIPIFDAPLYAMYSSGFYVVGYGRNPIMERRMKMTQNKAIINGNENVTILHYDRNKIQRLDVNVIFSYPACRIKPSIPADQGYICAYDRADEGVCEGDSGSGLYRKHSGIQSENKEERTYLVGIVSKAAPCIEGKDWVNVNYQLYTDVYEQSGVYKIFFPNT